MASQPGNTLEESIVVLGRGGLNLKLRLTAAAGRLRGYKARSSGDSLANQAGTREINKQKRTANEMALIPRLGELRNIQNLYYMTMRSVWFEENAVTLPCL